MVTILEGHVPKHKNIAISNLLNAALHTSRMLYMKLKDRILKHFHVSSRPDIVKDVGKPYKFCVNNSVNGHVTKQDAYTRT